MNSSDISVLLKKAEELKALFVLGQRVIPFLEEIFLFVNDIKPMLDEINQSIEENLKKMPNASKQLSKVTEATEISTTEIMDIVDGVVYKTDIILKNVKELSSANDSSKNIPFSILKLIMDSIQKKEDFSELGPKLKESIEELKNQSNKNNSKLVEETEKLAESIQMDSSSIMMSLQVQDITSQQIAAVNHIIITIQEKLVTILNRFQESDISELVEEKDEYTERMNISTLHRDIAFDPDAVDAIAKKEFRQGEVDQMMKDHQNGSDDDVIGNDDHNQPASQDAIDDMFSNQSDDSEVETTEDHNQPASQDAIDDMFSNQSNDSEVETTEDLSEPASQDAIDDMFSNQDNDDEVETIEDLSEPASQDAIDDIFSNQGNDDEDETTEDLSEPASQDAIDDMFSNQENIENSDEEINNSQLNDSNNTNIGKESKEIDDNDNMESVSQDDIDALFN